MTTETKEYKLLLEISSIQDRQKQQLDILRPILSKDSQTITGEEKVIVKNELSALRKISTELNTKNEQFLKALKKQKDAGQKDILTTRHESLGVKFYTKKGGRTTAYDKLTDNDKQLITGEGASADTFNNRVVQTAVKKIETKETKEGSGAGADDAKPPAKKPATPAPAKAPAKAPATPAPATPPATPATPLSTPPPPTPQPQPPETATTETQTETTGYDTKLDKLSRIQALSSYGLIPLSLSMEAVMIKQDLQEQGQGVSDADISRNVSVVMLDNAKYLTTLQNKLIQFGQHEYPDRNIQSVEVLKDLGLQLPHHQTLLKDYTQGFTSFMMGAGVPNKYTAEQMARMSFAPSVVGDAMMEAEEKADDDEPTTTTESLQQGATVYTDSQTQTSQAIAQDMATQTSEPTTEPAPVMMGIPDDTGAIAQPRDPRNVVRGDLSRSAPPGQMMQQAQSTMQQGADGAEEMRVASMKLRDVKARIRALHTAYAGMLPEFETPEHKANKNEALKATAKNAEKARLHLIEMFKSIRAYFAGGSNIPGGLQVGIVIPAQDYLQALMGSGGGGGGCGCKHDDHDEDMPTANVVNYSHLDDPETITYNPPRTRPPMGTSTKGKPHPGDVLKDRHGRDSFGQTFAVSNHYRNSGVERSKGVAGYQAPTVHHKQFSKPREPPATFPNMSRDAIRFHRRPKGMVPGLKINTTKM